MGYQTDLDEALRDWGLNVIEVNGWQWRGSSSFNPGGSVNHHTAGYRHNSIPSLPILIDGHGTLPGPLCNVGQSRSTQYNPSQEFDDVYLIAAGRANHAGKGSWQGLTGNSSVFGLEIEHTGSLSTEPWPERRQHTAFRVHCAFAEVGGFDVSKVCQHKEWAPTRKIDFIGSDGHVFRDAVALTILAKNPIQNITPEDDDMISEIIRTYYKLARGENYEVAVSDPRGYLHWLTACYRSSDPASIINNHLAPGLEKERNITLPRV